MTLRDASSSPLRPALPVLAALTLALVACGPGTGGSGDGDNALLRFGASAATVCTSSIAGSLDCPPTTSGAPTSGTAMVFYSDTTAGNNVAVRLQNNGIELSARCLGLQFEGQWGIVAPNDARFFGTFTNPTSPRPTLGSLTVGMGANSQELFVLLRDAEGRVVLPATVLRRVSAPVANPAACPG